MTTLKYYVNGHLITTTTLETEKKALEFYHDCIANLYDVSYRSINWITHETFIKEFLSNDTNEVVLFLS